MRLACLAIVAMERSELLARAISSGSGGEGGAGGGVMSGSGVGVGSGCLEGVGSGAWVVREVFVAAEDIVCVVVLGRGGRIVGSATGGIETEAGDE